MLPSKQSLSFIFLLLLIANVLGTLLLGQQLIAGAENEPCATETTWSLSGDESFMLANQSRGNNDSFVLFVEDIQEEEQRRNKNAKSTSKNDFAKSNKQNIHHADRFICSTVVPCSIALNIGARPPLYELYHCWKSFLMF